MQTLLSQQGKLKKATRLDNVCRLNEKEKSPRAVKTKLYKIKNSTSGKWPSIYLPTPPHEQEATQGQFVSGIILGEDFIPIS